MADTLREYLVSLGFSVDEAKMHRFQDALTHIGRSAGGLSAEVVGVGYALTEMVERVARHFEDLYYMSQRTGATVSGLNAIGFAAQQVGLSSEQARGAVEGFADAMRMNPGIRGMAQGLLGRQDIDPERDLPALIKRLSTMQDYVAIRFAERFGISSQVYLQLKNNMKEFEQANKDVRRAMAIAGVDLDKDKDRWVLFERQMNLTTGAFKAMGDRIADDWRPAIQGLLKDIQGLAEGFNQANKSSEGMLGKITSLIAAFGGVAAVLAIVGRVFGFKGGALAGRLGLIGLPLWGIHEMIQSGAAAEQKRKATNPETGQQMTMGEYDRAHGLVPKDVFSPVVPTPFVNPRRVNGQPQNLTGPVINMHQTNHISGRNAEEIARRVADSNREFGDALRNLSQKIA